MSDVSKGYILEFNNHLTGLGQSEVEGAITKYEAMLCIEHWLKMLWAVEGTGAEGSAGSWEIKMWQYANYRINALLESGAISDDEYQRMYDSIDWPHNWDLEKEFEEMIDAYVKEHAEELNPANWSIEEFLTELDNPSRSEAGQEDSARTDTTDTIDW